MKGGVRWGFATITLDGSYPGAGWPITAANLKLNEIYYLEVPAVAEGATHTGYPLRWDHATGKLLAFETNTTNGPLQEIDGAELSGEVIRCLYMGW
jgi:hypothetical protein